MSSFDDADRRAKYAVVPKRANADQVVKLEPKKLKTHKEVRVVLPEDKYVSGLEEIIQRDYFPELPKLKAQNEYLAAQERNDIAKMRELQLQFKTTRRTERRTSPGKAKFESSPKSSVAPSPAVFDPATPGPSRPQASSSSAEDKQADPDGLMTPLPGSNPEGDNEVEKKKSELEGMTVDQYLYKYTSEDNASFEEVRSLESKRHTEKIQWLYDAAEKHNKERITHKPLAVNADEQLALKFDKEEDKAKPKALDNWSYTAHSHVLFFPEEVALLPEEVEARKKANQRVINKHATRFPHNAKLQPSESSMARAAFSQAAQLAGKVDVMGNELGVVKNQTLGMVVTPSPAPGVDDSPFMTWGEIDNTPFRLDAADMEPAPFAAPTFKMPALPAREMLAQSMTDTIGKRFNEKRKHAMKMIERAHKTPGSLSSPSSLSPAAIKLKQKLGIRTGAKTPLVSPSPLTRSPLVRTPSSNNRGGTTPAARQPPASPAAAPSITDNLLNVSFPSPRRDLKKEEEEAAKGGKRAKAGDFF